jgi:membrane-associated protease RseP (regulator of RpoE activity)
LAIAPPGAPAQSAQITQAIQGPSLLLLGTHSQGYLGVWVDDVDKEKADSLKLKEVRGAVITLIDHDAPAGQIPLKVNDVVLELNGQPVEGAEQLKRMLHEIPPGRKVTLVISRDGALQTATTQMADHKKMVEGFWTKIGNGGDIFGTGPGMTLLPGGDTAPPSGFHLPIFGSSLNVGAMVEPLTSQMAEYLGVPNGVMVKQVARKTEADAAGLKAFDVILKVGADSIGTLSDWERALHANQGKPVQLTVLRDKKQQILTLQVDSKHNRGELDFEEIFPSGDCPVMALNDEGNPENVQEFAWDDAAAADGLSDQAQALRDQIQAGGFNAFEVDPKQAEELRKQAEKLRDQMKSFDFKVDPKTMDELNQQVEKFRKDFNSPDFQFDQKQFDELKQQMEEWRKSSPQQFKFDKDQLEQFKRQMEEMSVPAFGQPV